MKISHTPSWIGFLSVVGYSRSTDLLCGPSTSDLTTRLLLRHQINRPEFPESKRQNFRNPQRQCFRPSTLQNSQHLRIGDERCELRSWRLHGRRDKYTARPKFYELHLDRLQQA